MSLIITPKTLSGSVKIPPSKSMAHRMLICAGLSEGNSTIKNIALSDDVKATIGALEKMGRIIKIKASKCEISGILSFDGRQIDCKESGSTLRFLIPIISALGGGELIGEVRLGERPLTVYKDIFKSQGMTLKEGFPLKISGKLKSGEFIVKGNISSQFISGLMFAAPLMEGDTRIILSTKLQSKGYVHMTIQAMAAYGIKVKTIKEDKEFLIEKNQLYKAKNTIVEGDWSQAGFWLLAGVKSEDGILIEGLSKKTYQGDIKIVEIVKNMGGNISFSRKGLLIKNSSLNKTNVDISQVPDLAPVVAGLMAVSGKKCILRGCERLRIKESDRVESIVNTLIKLGSNATVKGNSIIIKGMPKGGSIKTFKDHRIAMMAAALAPHCDTKVNIDDETVVNKSYPAFWDDYKNLGGRYV